MTHTVNKAELALIHGVSEQTLTTWQEQGLPVLSRGARGESNEYDTAATIEWRVARDVKKVQSEGVKDRLARLQGDKLQLEIEEKNGTLVPSTEIEPVWLNRVMSAAGFLASRASRLAGVLEATPGLEAKRNVLKQEDEAFLNQLGVDGDRIQVEFEGLLARVSEIEAADFMKRIAGNGPSHPPSVA